MKCVWFVGLSHVGVIRLHLCTTSSLPSREMSQYASAVGVSTGDGDQKVSMQLEPSQSDCVGHL